MTQTEQQYREAWERIKTGKPLIVGKNMPINQIDTVALEAGKKKGSLRKNKYPDLCKEIMEYEVVETRTQECVRLKEQYRVARDEKEALWKGALARELMMKKRLVELEMELKRIKKKYPGVVFKLDNLGK
jgi:hypothetical protein